MAIAAAGGGEIEDVSTNFASCSFPPIVEHDLKDYVSAVVAATTLEGDAVADTTHVETMARLLLQAFGIKDVNPIVAEIVANRAEMEAQRQERSNAFAAAALNNPPAAAPPANQKESALERLERLTRDFAEALRSWRKRVCLRCSDLPLR